MSISISINAGADQSSSSVTATGSIQHIISDSERAAFGIQDAALKAAIQKYLGLFAPQPDDAFVCSPTPWGDLYSTYGWPQVQTLLSVQSATVLGITSAPEIIATKTFTNSSNVAGTYNCDITQSVNTSATSSWSSTSSVEIGQTISYDVSFLGSGGGGETSLTYTQAWEKGGSETESIDLGTSAGVTVELQPGQSVDAELTASRGTMTVQVVYQLSLSGDIAANFSSRYNGHHFWAYDVNSVLAAAGIPTTITSTETITIGFYANSTIVLKNPAGQPMLRLLASARPALAA